MKLKKLIVHGFKSFADRTEFVFDDGISCVVGPNGCGKSNVVDAIKWVLGEQSAKSLRGGEMMDVIFNGCATRKAGGSAEVTLVFDNHDGLLKNVPGVPSDTIASEVSVTRRLFRNGQSDYLINKNTSRLRDIREMFMDTGVGVDAYSLIEQGRVESFLQASQDDRRAIFDEAAGISKYKARRKEALRKLERVDQNVLRLADVMGEMEKRLRSIKQQAGKARNYQGYVERLKDLRSLNFLAQYHSHSGQRTSLRSRLDGGVDSLSSLNSRLEQLETTRGGADVEAADLERTGRELEGRLAALGGMINASSQRAEMLEARVRELAEQIVSATASTTQLAGKIESCSAEIASRCGELDQIEAHLDEVSKRCDEFRGEHTRGEMALNELAAALEDEKSGAIDLMRRMAQLNNEIQGLTIRRENLTNHRGRLTARAQEITTQLQGLADSRGKTAQKLAEVKEALSAAQARHDETRQARGKLINSEQALQGQLATAREQRSGVLSRIHALTEMQQRLEGIGAGVRRVLKAKADGKVGCIRGMLGDFLRTDVKHAPLVEAALAGADQQLVVDKLQDVQLCADELAGVLGDNGSVEILCLDRLDVLTSDFDLAALTAAGELSVARIIDFVQCDSQMAPALWRLLGRTLVVSSLEQARSVSAITPPQWRFVTLAGEVLEADGRVRLGSANRGAGVITRRSELAELEAHKTELDQQISQLDQQCRTTRTQRQELEDLDQSLRQTIYEANTERVENESRLGQLDEQMARLQREEPLIASDVARLAQEIDASIQSEQQARGKVAELEQASVQRQQQVEALTEQIAVARSRQVQLNAQMTELKVALASAQQKKVSLREAQAALLRQKEAMEKDLAAARSQIELNGQRRTDAEAGIVSARAEVQKYQAQQESLAQELQEVEESRRGLAEKLEQIRQQLAELRRSQEQAAAAVNALRVELGESDVRIENLIARASEEMGMNLVERYTQYQHDENRDWAAVEAEIADLRGKIERLGNVNLDAIAEQEELEKRSEFLGAQLADVKKSQDQLNELIRRINKESREMFVTTFETIRGNFHELFRKLFGGGKSDILLLNPEDVLESPIEIVARPPGKELRSLSLLSGGEKTMTALALLFSIFRSRPSPFCVLDEVDAALDEANNRRFGTLVSDFVSQSQFIIISHSKRTMSLANVLYGVTMQEPGVSKRISVKFEEAASQVDEQLQSA